MPPRHHAAPCRLVLAAAPLLALAACASSGAGGRPGRAPAPADSVVIDASKGDVSTGPTRVGTRQTVHLVVRNVNPFVHRYRIAGSRTTYTEAAVAEFAKALGVPIAVPEAPKQVLIFDAMWTILGRAGGDAAGCAGNVADAVRADADVRAAGLTMHVGAVQAHGTALSGALAAAQRLVDSAGRVLDGRAERIRDAAQDERSLRARVDSVYDLGRWYADTLARRHARLGDSVTAYNRGLADLAARAAADADKYPACAAFAQRRAEAARWTLDTAVYRGAVTTLGAHATAAATLVATVERVRSAPEALSIRREFGGYDDPTAVDLLVQRSPVGPDTVWRTVASPRLSFGGRRRFAVGIGATASRLVVADYAVVHRYRAAPASQPADTTETVVVETARTNAQVAPLVGLTARVASLPLGWLDGLHLAIGTAPRTAQSKLTLDYFVGGALSAADERILVGLGVVSAEERRIAGGLAPGARVPAAQTTVPTRSARVTRPAVSLSFRVF